MAGLENDNYEGSIDQDVYSKDLQDIQTKDWHESKYKGPNREIYEQMSIAKDNDLSERVFSADAVDPVYGNRPKIYGNFQAS